MGKKDKITVRAVKVAPQEPQYTDISMIDRNELRKGIDKFELSMRYDSMRVLLVKAHKVLKENQEIVAEAMADARNKRFLKKNEVRGRLAGFFAQELLLRCPPIIIPGMPLESDIQLWADGKLTAEEFLNKPPAMPLELRTWAQNFLMDEVEDLTDAEPFDYDNEVLNAKWMIPISGRFEDDVLVNYVANAFSKSSKSDLSQFAKDFMNFLVQAMVIDASLYDSDGTSLLPIQDLPSMPHCVDEWHEVICGLAEEKTAPKFVPKANACDLSESRRNKNWKELLDSQSLKKSVPSEVKSGKFKGMLAPGVGLVDNRMTGSKQNPLFAGVVVTDIMPQLPENAGNRRKKDSKTNVAAEPDKKAIANAIKQDLFSAQCRKPICFGVTDVGTHKIEFELTEGGDTAVCRNPSQEEIEAVCDSFLWASLFNHERMMLKHERDRIREHQELYDYLSESKETVEKLQRATKTAQDEASQARAELAEEKRYSAALEERNAKLEKRVEEAVAKSESRDYEVETLQKQVEALQQMLAAPPETDDVGTETALDTSILDEHKVICIGGFNSWAESMRTLHPNLRVFAADDPVPDDGVLDSADCIWIQSQFISHKTSKPICDRARANGIPLRFFNTMGQRRCKEELIRGTEEALLGDKK